MMFVGIFCVDKAEEEQFASYSVNHGAIKKLDFHPFISKQKLAIIVLPFLYDSTQQPLCHFTSFLCHVCRPEDVASVDVHAAKDLLGSGHRYLDVRWDTGK